MVETVFSVMKRKFGEALNARKYRLQIKEIKIKIILYNLSRMISSLSFLVLLRNSTEPIIHFFLLSRSIREHIRIQRLPFPYHNNH
jgi:hypothetical protein